MDVLLVAQYFGNLEQLDKSNNRFIYLAALLAKTHSVEVLTTSFIHAEKKESVCIPSEYNGFKITALSEPGYKKNVSIKRFFSHKKLAANMHKYINERKKPDVIYCAVPSLDCAYVAAKYAKKNNVPFIVDIQDLWPEAFKMVFKFPGLKDLLFLPMECKANYIYSSADYIIGVSETYCRRAEKVNLKASSVPVFLGTNLDTFDTNVKKNRVLKNKDTFVIGYCGSMGHSYDLKCVFNALEIISSHGVNNVELWLMGKGPLYQVFEEYAAKKSIKVKFWGWVPYEQMCGILASCDACINPISKGSAASIINKHADYAATGLPIINTQECPEYRELIEHYKCGINCSCSDSQEVADAIIYLIQHEAERKRMGINSRIMADELFDRKKSYTKILDIVAFATRNSHPI